MGNCDFRSSEEINDKKITLEQEKYKARSSGPILLEKEDNNSPNIEKNRNDENEFNYIQNTFSNEVNDPSKPPANIESDNQNRGEVDVDQVIYVETKEKIIEEKLNNDYDEHNDSLEIQCSGNYNAELTNKKKTENFKVEHPLKTHGIDNFKKGFKGKIKEIVVQEN